MIVSAQNTKFYFTEFNYTMPFTFSHPAIVLPLAFLPKRWFSFTGLIIGSLAPDFEYFLRMRIQSDVSHSIGGLFLFNLPLAVLIAFLFHNTVRDRLYENLPTALKSRLIVYTQFNWNKYFTANWFVVLVSILIGASSHILWDGFTHAHSYFVETHSSLSQTIELFHHQIPIWKILQHSSTLLGGFVIILTFFRLPVAAGVTEDFNLKYWGVFAFLATTIVVVRLLSGLDYHLYGHVIATIISATIIALILTPLIINQYGSKIRI